MSMTAVAYFMIFSVIPRYNQKEYKTQKITLNLKT